MTTLLPAFIGLLGVVVGIALQFFFTARMERTRHLRDLRTTAYADYLRAVAENAHRQVLLDVGEVGQILARAAEAKSRICVFGTKPVLNALRAFEEGGAALASAEGMNNFARLMRTMRQDVAGRRGALPDGLLDPILFGSEEGATGHRSAEPIAAPGGRKRPPVSS